MNQKVRVQLVYVRLQRQWVFGSEKFPYVFLVVGAEVAQRWVEK